MEHSQIPFQSKLKPPTPVSAIVTSRVKPATKVLQPRVVNKHHDDITGLPTARQVLRRRSKSFNDLKTAGNAKPTFDPLAKVNALRSNLTSRKPITKSTSTSNLHSQVQKPAIKYSLKTIPEKPQSRLFATNSKATKRTAPPAEEANKPKVAKVAKPAPYDYKARFNLLSEKYTNLLQAHKDTQQKLSEAESDLQQYNILKEDHTKLQNEYDSICDKNSSLEIENKHLLKEFKEYNELKRKFSAVVSENEQNKEYVKDLQQRNTSLDSELKNLKADHSTLTEDHVNLQDKYNKLHCSNVSLTEISNKLETELEHARSNIHILQEKLHLCRMRVAEHEDLRRAMHNQIQDLKGTIRVFCRVRPAREEEDCKLLCNITYLDEETLEIKKSKESINVISGKPADLKQEFGFDKVFPPEATQAEIFDELSQLIQSALDGYHICVFAYGQTGSGKTYTMQGENPKQYDGMIPKTINLLFHLITKLQEFGWTYSVEASFLEIYNETIRDLLNPNNKEHLEIRFNEGRGTSVTNLTVEGVRSIAELQQLMIAANENRSVAVTNYNEHSSRSHAVTKISVTGKNEERQTVYVGSLSLVDLAGSESAKTSNAERINETKNINKSLSTLGTVMAALHNREHHIPYRNSKLTYLLQSSLGGNSKTLMFVNIAPFEECYNESINALRFASKVKEVKIGSKRNKTYLRK